MIIIKCKGKYCECCKGQNYKMILKERWKRATNTNKCDQYPTDELMS